MHIFRHVSSTDEDGWGRYTGRKNVNMVNDDDVFKEEYLFLIK